MQSGPRGRRQSISASVTEAIHEAHGEAAVARVRFVPKPKRVIEIAAVADEGAERKRKTSRAGKRGATKRSRRT